jgi:hypothetical protein
LAPSAAQGLYWGAYRRRGTPEKIAITSGAEDRVPPEKFSWAESGMSDLFDVLAATDPDKARALADDMLKRVTAKSEQKSWADQAAYATALSESAALRAKGDAKGAVQRLDGVKTPRSYMDQVPIALAPRRSRPREIRRRRIAAWPRSPPRRRPMRSAAVTKLGGTLGKSAETIDADLWRCAKPRQARPALRCPLSRRGSLDATAAAWRP